MIAKTKWLANIVESYHNVTVLRVVPSLDHNIFYPGNEMLRAKLTKSYSNGDLIRVTSMIRPRTSRRNPIVSLDILLKLAYNYRTAVEVIIFGSTETEVYDCLHELRSKYGIQPHRSIDALRTANVKLLGLISDRREVAALLRSSDIFIDASLWQAFGQTAADAMACGCIPILPTLGGSLEFCSEELDLCRDSNDADSYYNLIVRILTDDVLRRKLVNGVIRESWKMTLEEAAASMASTLLTSFVKRNA
jgi:glycosyltransferase involved in cell wall biosynthesis